MSLKGSLETIALPEVLHLLADTGKSGELRVSGTRPGGRLRFDAGLLSGFEVGSSPDPADALFQLLRVDSGEFAFDADAEFDQGVRTPEGGAQDVRPALLTAQGRLAEWVEIVRVVPSLDHQVHLVDEAPRDEVVVDRFQWSLLVAVGEGHPVQHVLDARGLPEFDGCKALKGLVDASLVWVSDPVSPEVVAVEETVVEEPMVQDHDVYNNGAADDYRVDEIHEPVEDVHEPADEIHEPVEDVHKPADEIHEPVEDVHEPASDYLGSFDSVIQDAVAEVQDEPPVEPAGEQSQNDHAHDYQVVAAASEVGAVDGDAPSEAQAQPGSDGRDAMRALLAELSPRFDEPVADPVSEPVDGLMDRGPWTSSELEQMGGWHQDDARDAIAWPEESESAPQAEVAVSNESGSAFHPGSGYDSDVAEATQPAEGDHLADFGFPLRAAEHGVAEVHEGSVSGDEQGGYEVGSEEVPEEEPAEEPMNRGLLLKFLSSVRN